MSTFSGESQGPGLHEMQYENERGWALTQI